MLTAHGHPWISSAWRGAHLTIWQPGPDPEHPRRLLDEDHSARMTESIADLAADATGLSARFLSWNRLARERDESAREVVRHFSLDHGAYRRTAPFVVHPGDLPDEWLHSSWSEASLFTVPSVRSRLAGVHDALRANREMIGLLAPLEMTPEGDRQAWTIQSDDPSLRYTFVVATIEGQPLIADVRGPSSAAGPATSTGGPR